MKTIIKIFGAAIVLLLIAASSMAQVSDQAYAEAHIITPLTIDKQVDMDFGDIAVINAIGTVVLSTSSTRTSTGGATPVANASIVTAAEFDITGTAGEVVEITIQGVDPVDADIEVHHSSTADLMHVTDFVCGDPVNFVVPAEFVIPAGGSLTVYIGATLNTGISQEPGTYHTLTDFVVEINYQ